MRSDVTQMKGHGEKMTLKREQAIAALLSCETVADAANATGVSEGTLWRWLRRPDFMEQYKAAQRQGLDNAIAELQGASSDAVAALRRNLHCENPAVEVRSAATILDLILKVTEQRETQERISKLEELLHDNNRGATPKFGASYR